MRFENFQTTENLLEFNEERKIKFEKEYKKQLQFHPKTRRQLLMRLVSSSARHFFSIVKFFIYIVTDNFLLKSKEQCRCRFLFRYFTEKSSVLHVSLKSELIWTACDDAFYFTVAFLLLIIIFCVCSFRK